MEVICLQSEALYTLVDEVTKRIKESSKEQSQDKWISDVEALKKLRITSKTTLAYMRNEGKIRYTQPRKKIILYDRESIDEYLEKHARNTF